MNIVVVGGGTAGWLTALYAKKIYTEDNIILIESEEYGVLGAGEGSTPHFIDFLNFLDISFVDLIKNCQSTIKNGIKFTNWSNDNDSYFHPFFSNSKASHSQNFNLNNFYFGNSSELSHYCASLKNHTLKDYSFVEKISYKNLLPFTKNENNIIVNEAQIALHFDANLLANYLKLIGKKRGIIRKEGIVDKIFNDKNGYIFKVKTKKEEIECDFIFDCSGFKKLIIGNHYKSSWKPHSDTLPAKKAIPFFLEMDKQIPPYTEAIAMNYGWMWKIPLQHRYGCGYVYDSDLISDEDAIKEIEDFLGFKPHYPRKEKGALSFSSGCFKEIWINNSLSVGLSSGFLEPLEASSIMQTISVLQRFMSDKQNISTKNKLIKKRFNDLYLKETEEIVDFLYLHYVTNKKNTVFWENFIKNNKIPKRISHILEVCTEKVLYKDVDLFDTKIFDVSNYYYVLVGNKIIDNVSMGNIAKFILNDTTKQNYENILNEQEKIIPRLLTHNYFIDTIKE
jgi:tryptophan halogenase